MGSDLPFDLSLGLSCPWVVVFDQGALW
jgi:hypothetical protein